MTIHVDPATLLIIGIVILFGALGCGMRLARAFGDEFADFVKWWRKFRRRLGAP